MIVDLERGERLPQFLADVCIVGAGAAGIVLASELLRQGKRVLLLESGGLSLEPASQALNECLYTGQPHRGASLGRFRALGGTTTVWGGQVLELNAEDFNSRSWIPGSGWPFAKDELVPFYERALVAEGLQQSIRDDGELSRQSGTGAPELGDAFAAYCTRWCPEPDFARLYRRTFDSPHLLLVLHATANAILLDENGSRISGLRCRTLSGKEQVFSAARYVLSLGTIESVRFLLQPLSGGQTPPWNRSGLLGRHLQSHIDCNVARIPAAEAARLEPWFANIYLGGQKYHPKFRLTSSFQQREKILNVAGSVTCLNPAETELRRVKAMARSLLRRRPPDAEAADLPRLLRQLPTMLQLAYSYRVRRRAAWPKDSAFWLRVHCEQEPHSESRITLTDARDATGLFRAHLDWRVSPPEWKTIRRFTEQAARTFAGLGVARMVLRPELALEEGFGEIAFDDSHHHMGGARMAVHSAEGVVSPDLKLHGVENAYLCSAAVFPTSGFSNPTHTLIALAIRLADRLQHS